jgi:acetylornithine deacetylase/succinyl-diaminopimelate desuccinylase-like protein
MLVPKDQLKDFEKALKACGLPVEYRDINTSGYYEAQILWEAWKCPVVVFGPSPNGMSHQANEHVNLKSVDKTREVVAKYLEYNL